MFKPGDIVRLKKGWTPMLVVYARKGMVGAVYSEKREKKFKNTGNLMLVDKLRKEHEFVLWRDNEVPLNPNTKQPTENHWHKEKEMPALYTWTVDGKERFGTHLATDSSGFWIMEPRGGGEPVRLLKADVTKVIPHTVEVRLENATKHFRAPRGELKAGDFVLMKNGSVAEVVNIDTKREKHSGALEGMVLQGRPLGSVE